MGDRSFDPDHRTLPCGHTTGELLDFHADGEPAELAEHARLTPRETEILALVAQGKNGPAIMQELFIAEGTFKAHMSHIYEKCGVANRRELVALLGAK